MIIRSIHDFASWRQAARILLAQQVAPEEVQWRSVDDDAEPFAGATTDAVPSIPQAPSVIKLPKAFYAMAEMAACHRDAGRWHLLYQVVYRLAQGEPRLLEDFADPAVAALHEMERAVRQDVHKMRAFVRFRAVRSNGGTRHVAWYQPAHRILGLNAPFFMNRFSGMGWSILTPDRCLHWDGDDLFVSPGVDRTRTSREDNIEVLWVKHYEAEFNAARLELKAAGKSQRLTPAHFGAGTSTSIDHLIARSESQHAPERKLAA